MPSPRIRQASRRSPLFGRAALGLAIVAGLVSACTVVPSGQGQPQHSGPPAHTLYALYTLYQKPVKSTGDLAGNSTTLVVAAMGAGDGKKVWQTTLPAVPTPNTNGRSNGDLAVRHYVVVSGPIVYAVASIGQAGSVAALDAYTGAILWKLTEETGATFDVKAANGVLYLQLGLTLLQALDGASGKSLWKLAAGANYTLGSSAIAGQTFYIVEQSFGPERLHDPDPATYTFVHAFRGSDGKEIWRGSVEKTDNTVGYRLQADDQRVYVLKPSYETGGQNQPGEVTALSARDGSGLWTYSETRFLAGDFGLFDHTLVGKTLYLVASTVTALDTQDGRPLSSYDTPFSLAGFLPSGHLYGLTLNKGEGFCSLALANGSKQWCAPVEQFSQIVGGQAYLYFLGTQGSGDALMVLRQSDGTIVAQYQIGDPLRTVPEALTGQE